MNNSSCSEIIPFSKIEENSSHNPHLFEAYRYDRNNSQCWLEIVTGCLECWRITAQAFYERIPDTGFQKLNLGPILNLYGTEQLPPTPPENSNVTKNPAITDLTEIIALRMLRWRHGQIVLPYPRVLHKESFRLQHHGIDALGYESTSEGFILYIIEIMASVDSDHPPTTVRDHLTQLLDNTLNINRSPRLLQDLQTVHGESEDAHKDILNGFITAVIEGTISGSNSVIATPLLVRRFNEFHIDDWKPFMDSSHSFGTAAIPSQICFLTVECHDSFSGMLDLVKQTMASQN